MNTMVTCKIQFTSHEIRTMLAAGARVLEKWEGEDEEPTLLSEMFVDLYERVQDAYDNIVEKEKELGIFNRK